MNPRLDIAEEQLIYIGANPEPNKEWKAIVNADRQHVACIASSDYHLIQHNDVADSFLNACDNLGLKYTTRTRDARDWFFMDVEFDDMRIKLEQKGEEYTCGFRIGNSYDKSSGVFIMPRIKRMVCSNGMVVEKLIKSHFNYKHTNSQLNVQFEEFVELALKELINSDKRLQMWVSACMEDSVEWEIAEKVLGHLIGADKHREAIKKRIEKDENGHVTRWDVYNAITNYATHGMQIKPSVEDSLQRKAQKLLLNDFGSIFAEIPEVV